MKTLIPSETRGQTSIGWLQSHHSFSFGEYFDPARMGFGPLRVINEDVVAPAAGFPMHGHANMEIVTVVLSGALAHKDSLGNGSTIRPGDVQLMRAGTGIRHSEFNPAEDAPVHLLQIWIMPDRQGAPPAYQEASFDPAGYKDRWRVVVSPDGAEGSLTILQDARLFLSELSGGQSLALAPDAARKYWLQVAKGSVEVEGRILHAGDALALEKESAKADIKGLTAASLLLFDLPQ